MLVYSFKVCFRLNIVSLLLALITKNLYCTWIRVELKFLSVLPLILQKYKNSVYYYFIFQLIGSLMLIFSFTIFFSIYIFIFSLLLKLGLFPLYWWFPYIVRKSSWYLILLISTLKKFVYIYFLSIVKINPQLFYFILFSLWGGVFFIFFNSSLNIKQFLGWLSLIERGLVILLYFSRGLIFYLLLYFTFFFLLCLNLVYNQYSSVGLLCILFSGFPPFFSFFYKRRLINELLKKSRFLTIILVAVIFIFLVQAINFIKIGINFITFYSNSLYFFYLVILLNSFYIFSLV